MNLNEAISTLRTSGYIVEFLSKSYTNLKQIFDLIKTESKIAKDTVIFQKNQDGWTYRLFVKYPHMTLSENDKDFIELNDILIKKYRCMIAQSKRKLWYADKNFVTDMGLNVTPAEQAALDEYVKTEKDKGREAIILDLYVDMVYGLVEIDNSGEFYHISGAGPDIIMKKGIKASSVSHRMGQFSYNNSVFMFSTNAAKIRNEQKKKNCPERALEGFSEREIVELDISDYNGRRRDAFYVYRVKIHKGDLVYIDPDWQWRSAVFKFGNIKPEDIEYLGQGSEGLKNMYK